MDTEEEQSRRSNQLRVSTGPVKSAEDQIPARKEEASGQELPAQNLQLPY
jgi:hypothetical protein